MGIRELFDRERWVLPKEESCVAPPDIWSNKDMDPTPPEHQTWTSWTFFAYWISDLVNPGSWATVSSFVALGLTWWESCLAVFSGCFLVSIVIAANGVIGTKLHTPFAVSCRSVFGYWGSKFAVVSRLIIGCFWLSINSWAGGKLIALAIEAIWPSYARLPNHVPESQGATTRDFLSFFIFWVIQLPFVFIHPSKLKWVFNIKAVVVPIVAVGTLIWALKIATPSPRVALATPVNRAAPGKARFVAFMYAFTAMQGVWATLSVNIGDFSRYCRTTRANYTAMWALPMLFTVISIFAAISATCCLSKYGDALYQPYDVVAKWGTSSGGRAAMFLGALAWSLGIVTTNITANSVSAANDMCSLAPKYINIQRGQLIAVTIGLWGFVPWKVLNSATNFLNFMAAYSIVLAPIAVLMAFDFFVIKRQVVDVAELYRPNGRYRFSKGWNWRAFVALICAVAPNLPGMAAAIDAKINIGNIKYVYMVSNLSADIIAMGVYYALSKMFPDRNSLVDAKRQTEPFAQFPDDEKMYNTEEVYPAY